MLLNVLYFRPFCFYSFLIVLLLTGLVAMILVRALRRDIQRYNAEDIEDAKEDFGWKVYIYICGLGFFLW